MCVNCKMSKRSETEWEYHWPLTKQKLETDPESLTKRKCTLVLGNLSQKRENVNQEERERQWKWLKNKLVCLFFSPCVLCIVHVAAAEVIILKWVVSNNIYSTDDDDHCHYYPGFYYRVIYIICIQSSAYIKCNGENRILMTLTHCSKSHSFH